jgi:hypothetical protein
MNKMNTAPRNGTRILGYHKHFCTIEIYGDDSCPSNSAPEGKWISPSQSELINESEFLGWVPLPALIHNPVDMQSQAIEDNEFLCEGGTEYFSMSDLRFHVDKDGRWVVIEHEHGQLTIYPDSPLDFLKEVEASFVAKYRSVCTTWVPRFGETYWCKDSDGEVVEHYWLNQWLDFKNLQRKNVFKSKAEVSE